MSDVAVLAQGDNVLNGLPHQVEAACVALCCVVPQLYVRGLLVELLLELDDEVLQLVV